MKRERSKGGEGNGVWEKWVGKIVEGVGKKGGGGKK